MQVSWTKAAYAQREMSWWGALAGTEENLVETPKLAHGSRCPSLVIQERREWGRLTNLEQIFSQNIIIVDQVTLTNCLDLAFVPLDHRSVLGNVYTQIEPCLRTRVHTYPHLVQINSNRSSSHAKIEAILFSAKPLRAWKIFWAVTWAVSNQKSHRLNASIPLV